MDSKTISLFEDKEFVASIITLSAEDAKIAIEEKGGTITVEELNAIAVQLERMKNAGEITEEQLEDVSGGSATIFVAGVLWGMTSVLAGKVIW